MRCISCLLPLCQAAALMAGTSLACAAEQLAERLRVNGVPTQVRRLQGTDLASQLAAIEAAWRRTGDPVLPWKEAGGWRLLARRTGPWSEVLQVRSGGTPAAAYLSRIDVQRQPYPIPTLPLPSGCRAASTVESGGDAEQVIEVSAKCLTRLATVRTAWLDQLRAAGWRAGGRLQPDSYQFNRGAQELTVVLVPRRSAAAAVGAYSGGDWIVAMQRLTSRAGD
jgi:hypothetical protein